MNLQLPKDLDAETFCRQIGGDCDDYSDKFESLEEVFSLNSVSKNEKIQRDYSFKWKIDKSLWDSANT